MHLHKIKNRRGINYLVFAVYTAARIKLKLLQFQNAFFLFVQSAELSISDPATV